MAAQQCFHSVCYSQLFQGAVDYYNELHLRVYLKYHQGMTDDIMDDELEQW